MIANRTALRGSCFILPPSAFILHLSAFILAVCALAQAGEESLWIEAEHFDGLQGYCWPMRRTDKPTGFWGLSGPGWAMEWNQGGESGFLSIACAPGEEKAVAKKEVEIPRDGLYHVWVRYRDNRELSDRFQVKIEQPGGVPWSGTWGERPVLEEDNEGKLYWDGAFGWEGHDAPLRKGTAAISLLAAFPEKGYRQLDCLVLTTDGSYRPLIKERPKHSTWQLLESYRLRGIPADLEPLARKTSVFEAPPAWTPKTFKPGFIYLWNVAPTETVTVEEKDDKGKAKKVTKTVPAGWMRSDPNEVLYPHNLPPKALELFHKKYAGQKDVPIFSDSRIVPVFHGVGPHVLGLDGQPPEVAEAFAKWLDAGPNRLFGNLLNYIADRPMTPAGKAAFFEEYKERYVGGISGENLGYFGHDAKEVEKLETIASRRQYLQALSAIYMEGNRKKYQAVFGDDLAKVPNPYAYTIPCLSAGGLVWCNQCFLWGAETVGYESSAMTSSLLGMRTAFLRGAARQHGRKTATYRSCNFGDASTIFSSETGWYAKPENIFDNYYSVYSGAGMTWYKFDIWYQYMAGAALFYHEQGFDEFWTPGGTTAAGNWGLQLSPKGKLVDRFLRLTAPAQKFDRGVAFTPAAILVDFAHWWDPADFTPRSSQSKAPAARLTLHDRALQGLFWTAYHPIGPESEKPITALNETYVHGVFGDIFDVIYAYPDVKLWSTIDTYPIVFVGGDIEITPAEALRLKSYIEDGGTLVVADGQLHGPGVAALALPALGETSESDGYRWLSGASEPCQRFRFSTLQGGKALATSADGKPLCAAFERGKGRLVFVSVPYALGLDQQPIPVLARLLAHGTRGLLPLEVRGDVEWSLNKAKDGWMVTLLNAAGQTKPQQGIFPTDFRENRTVTILCRVPIREARDRLQESDRFEITDGAITCLVPAGGVRVLELK